MNTRTIHSTIRIICRAIVLAVIVLFAFVYVLPCLRMLWDMTFPHYDHEIAVLPFDVDCKLGDDDSCPIRLPKGTMIYSPCRHDYSRMSLDETCTYKIYVKLNPSSMKALIKDNDDQRRDEFLNMKKRGTIEECKAGGGNEAR